MPHCPSEAYAESVGLRRFTNSCKAGASATKRTPRSVGHAQHRHGEDTTPVDVRLAAIVTSRFSYGPAPARVAHPPNAGGGSRAPTTDRGAGGLFRGLTVRYLDLGAVKLAPGQLRSGSVVNNGTERSGTSSTSSWGRMATRRCGVTMVTWKGRNATDAEVGGRGCAAAWAGNAGHARSAPGSSSTARCSASTSHRTLVFSEGRPCRVPPISAFVSSRPKHGGADLGRSHERRDDRPADRRRPR